MLQSALPGYGWQMSLRNRTFLDALALIILCGLIFLPDIGTDRRVLSREGRHAEIAREMVTSGEYIVPHILGQPYTLKPPLFNWIAAACFALTGDISLGTARLPSALAATAMALAVYLLGVRLFNRRAGEWAALVLVTCYLVSLWGRVGRMDMLMASLITGALLFSSRAADAPSRRAAWALAGVAGFLLSAAVLSKGPQAIFFYGVPLVGLWRCQTGRWTPAAHLLVMLGVMMALCVGLWAVASNLNNPGHVRDLLGYEFENALTRERNPWHLYFAQLFLKSAPWSLFGFGAIWLAVRDLRARRGGPAMALAVSVVLGVLVLTLVKNKKNHYLLPLFPLWALLIGWYLDRAVALLADPDADPALRRACRWLFELPLTAMLFLFAVAGLTLPALWPLLPVPGQAVGVAGCLMAGLAALWAGAAARQRRFHHAVGGLMAIALFATILFVPIMNRYFWHTDSCVAYAEQIERIVPKDIPLAAYGPDDDDELFFFSLRRPVLFLDSSEAFQQFLRDPRARYVLVDHNMHKDHPEWRLPDAMRLVPLAELSERPPMKLFELASARAAN